MNEYKDRRSLIERQVGEILYKKDNPVNRLAQLPPTLARHFSEPGTKERMLIHGTILAAVGFVRIVQIFH